MDNIMKLQFASKSENESFARTACSAFVMALDPTVEEMTEIKTAISEAVTNAIIHGYGEKEGTITITGTIDNRQVTYIIHDDGCGIPDIEKAKEPLYTGKSDSERSGMGFSIMEAFMDKLVVESDLSVGTTVTMVKELS